MRKQSGNLGCFLTRESSRFPMEQNVFWIPFMSFLTENMQTRHWQIAEPCFYQYACLLHRTRHEHSEPPAADSRLTIHLFWHHVTLTRQCIRASLHCFVSPLRWIYPDFHLERFACSDLLFRLLAFPQKLFMITNYRLWMDATCNAGFVALSAISSGRLQHWFPGDHRSSLKLFWKVG